MSDRISFTLREAAAMTGLSYETIRAAVNSGSLQANYPTHNSGNRAGKGLILRTELERWIADAPTHAERGA